VSLRKAPRVLPVIIVRPIEKEMIIFPHLFLLHYRPTEIVLSKGNPVFPESAFDLQADIYDDV